MVVADVVKLGDTIQDNKLGFLWKVVGRDGDGNLHIERNGVIAEISIWDAIIWRGPTDSPAAAEVS